MNNNAKVMEDQVPSSNIPQEQGNYYQNPEGPRFQNPAQFSTATQPLQEQPPVAPDFQEMRRLALEQAIQQVTQQPVPQPIAQVAPQAPQYSQPETNTVYVRRNLTLAELLVMFALSCGLVLGLQASWFIATDLLPRIEIREK
jgi:hypothetical protein